MQLQIESDRPATAAEWDAAWEASDYATYFHSRAWAELWQAYSRGRYTPDARKVLFNDGRTAVVPFSVVRRFRGLVPVRELSPSGTFGGWISQDELTASHAAALVEWICASGDIEWVTNPYEPHTALSMNDGGLPYCTWSFDLQTGDEELEARWRHNKAAVLRKFRAAEKNGLTLRRLEAENLDEFFELYLDCQRRWGGGSSFYQKEIFAQLLPTAACDFWGVFHPDGRMVCANILLRSRRHVACWVAVARSTDLGLRPYEYLYLSQIRNYRKEGYRWFDLCPSGGHEGVDQFKQRLGADRIACAFVQRRGALHRAIHGTRRYVPSWALARA